MEREEWSHKLIVLRNSESEKLDVLNKKHSEELSRHKQEIKQLVNNIDTLKDELRDVTIKTQREQELQGDYIKKTMNDQKKEFAEEFRQMTRSALVDSNVLKSQFDLQLQVVENNYKVKFRDNTIYLLIRDLSFLHSCGSR